MTDDEKVAIGESCQRILEDETFVAMVSRVHDSYVETWKNAESVEAREAAHYGLRAANALVAQFKAAASEAVHIQNAIARRRQQAEVRKKLGRE